MKNILAAGIILLFFSNFLDNNAKNNFGNFFESKNVNNISKFSIPDTMSFCGEKVPLNVQRVKEALEREFYLTLDKEGQVLLYIKRSGRYFPVIEDKLRRAGLPSDLKFIPIAESALINQTSIKGADGYWQLIESTAKKMGLKINDYIDERYDINKSTDAALKYLKHLNEIFSNWTLAVAAYNVGPENIKDNLDFQWKDNYYELYLNEETSRFIFRILALKLILSDNRKYGINLNEKDFYKPYETQQITVTEAIPNLSIWALNRGTSYLEVKTLNPWILGRNLPKGEYNILIPKDSQPKQIDISKYPYKEKITTKKSASTKKKKSKKK
jgi:hypothetical protein